MKVNLIIEQLPDEEELKKAKEWKIILEDNKTTLDEQRKIIKEIRNSGIHVTSNWNGDIFICISTSVNLADEFGMNLALKTLKQRYEKNI